jgi:hypothetical protein
MRTIHLDRFPDRPNVLKNKLMFVRETSICDGCDKKGLPCAVISVLGKMTTHMCQDCIEGILDTLDSQELRNRKISKILSN